jgi:sugar-specific transcriptional regulator TrmB
MENIKEILKEIGLSESEVIIYLTLLKSGEKSVAEISQISGLHRTNIYDSLEKLKEKGFISYLLKDNKQTYRSTDPKIILSYFKEKESKIEGIIPELNKLRESIKEKVSVEIFKGEQGIKSALRDILKEKQEVVGYNVSGQLRKFLPKFAEYYFIEQEKHRIKHKFIYTSGTPKPPNRYYEIKILGKEYAGHTITLCYKDKIINLIWEPEMIAIMTKSMELAEDYKKHFALLWKIAKKS